MNALILAACLSAAADAGTTHYGLTHGLREANPIIRSFGVPQHPARIYPVKALLTGGLLWATTAKGFTTENRRVVRWAMIGMNTALSVNNLIQIRRHAR